jgi:hypothetical protein
VRRDGEWKQTARARLRDRDLVRIGTTVLRFSAAAVPAFTAGAELAGCRIDRDLGGEAGVGRFAAWQLAMDRPVRLDTAALGPLAAGAGGGEPAVSLVAPLLEALERAARHDCRGIGTTLQRQVAERSGQVVLLFRLAGGTAFADDFAGIGGRDVAARLRAFMLLAELLLAGGREELFSYPIGARHVGWSGGLEPWVPALELSAWLIDRFGACAHFPSLIPYLPPEKIEASAGPSSPPGPTAAAPGASGTSPSGAPAGTPSGGLASRMYNLGALGYQLVTGSPPMGEGNGEAVLGNHLRLAPAPADAIEAAVPPRVSRLLERMLAKSPGERPASAGEVLDVLREVAGAGASPAVGGAVPAARAAPPGAPAEGEVVWDEMDDAPAAAAGVSARGAAAAGRRRTSLALLLPIWIILWAGLFVATRVLTEILLGRLRG